ncbi:MAG: hypothetical protein ACYC35_07610 [Pirellulales bacterium]
MHSPGTMLSTLMGVLTLATLALRPGVAADTAPGAKTYTLRSGLKPGDVARVKAMLEVGGNLNLVENEKPRTLPMNVVGRMSYEERIVQSPGKSQDRLRSIRYYDQAEAAIEVDKVGRNPRLRNARRLVGVEIQGGAATLFSPAGALSRDELDLIGSVHGNSLLLEALLPNEPVSQGKTWKTSDQNLAVLLDLEAVSQNDVQSVLSEVDRKWAKIELAGRVDGAFGGVATEMEIKGKYKFDFQLQRITSLVLLVKEKRSIGHIAPGVDLIAKLQMTIAPIAKPVQLTDATIKNVAFAPQTTFTDLSCDSRLGGFQFLHDRRWHLMADDPKLVALRMVDRGELVAQCNVSPLPKTMPGKHVPLSQFQEDIKQALGKDFGQFLQASENNPEPGRIVYRVVASGKVSDVSLLWKYYLVADDQGNQAVFLFTLEDSLLQRLGDVDRKMVDSLRFTQTQVAEKVGSTK